MKKNLIIPFLTLLLLFFNLAAANSATGSATRFIENKKQLPNQVKYQVDLPFGNLYLEKNRLTYNFIEPAYFDLEEAEKGILAGKQAFKAHAFQINFVGANPQPIIEPIKKLPETRNYFIGSDPEKWSSEVAAYEKITYKSLYQGIDLVYYSHGNSLKYDYVVQPQANPEAIKMKYDGVSKLSISNGRLRISTSVNEILEERPYAYQLINGQQKEVACAFTLENNTVGFRISNTYDKNLPLIIDPALIYGTYTGSTSGMSANCTAVDNSGNLHTGGYILGTSYPTTMGAYRLTGRYGNVVISKFNAAGSGLLYATFLGGGLGSGGNDYPLALQVNQQNELIILGNTQSVDFPTSANAYDRTLGGGMDYFISKLSPGGNALVASTFIGGSAFEGGSLSGSPAGLAVDQNSNIYICGLSGSTDFPIMNGFQTSKKQGNDGIVAKLNNALTNLLWSSFIGTDADDVLSDIKIGTSGKIYLAGYLNGFGFGTINGLQTTSGALNPNSLGNGDGFVAVISPTGTQVLACTYIGTSNNDNLRFLDLDAAENIYITGYTAGAYSVTANTYTFPTTNRVGGFYIHKLNNALTSTLFSTHIGSDNNSNMQAPTAFNVDDCENIYLSSYIGSQNYPTTSNAYQRNLRSIYMCQLSPQAGSLIYGSFIGGDNTFGSHVHYANRSTITDDGHLYHIECTTSSNYPVTQGAFSGKVSMSNDGAMFKFKFDTPAGSGVKARIQNPILPGCAPYTVAFSNITIGGKNYLWDFGDGTATDTQTNPTHTFQNPGVYHVKLIATGQKSCTDPTPKNDTTIVQVEVKPNPTLPKQQELLCQGFAELDAGNPGSTYRWFNGATSQTIVINKPGSYQVEIDNGICKSTETIVVTEGVNLIVPNIFTPNGDNTNEYFVVPNGGPDTSFKLFNRWGVEVYSNKNYQNNWRGDNLTPGVYFYLIDSPVNCGKAKKGWVEIIR